ncbi:hypothetical protein LJK88_20590 [Paenibacillus sp. P26]|nr:hypothetical protein LJK88_20590 [Paenibacillus sp. P26]UUZ95966.1 hypothetical protein LJK87_17275 [Paenibacillus sp. P25]
MEAGATDYDVTVTHVAQAAQTGPSIGIRFSDTNNYVSLAWGYTAGVHMYTGGTFTSNMQLSSALNPAIAAGDSNTIRFVACGPMIIMWYKGNIVINAYEPRILKTGTKFSLAGSAATETYDNLVIKSIA